MGRARRASGIDHTLSRTHMLRKTLYSRHRRGMDWCSLLVRRDGKGLCPLSWRSREFPIEKCRAALSVHDGLTGLPVPRSRLGLGPFPGAGRFFVPTSRGSRGFHHGLDIRWLSRVCQGWPSNRKTVGLPTSHSRPQGSMGLEAPAGRRKQRALVASTRQGGGGSLVDAWSREPFRHLHDRVARSTGLSFGQASGYPRTRVARLPT